MQRTKQSLKATAWGRCRTLWPAPLKKTETVPLNLRWTTLSLVYYSMN
nr:MAG TPA: hypothetical protein [Caudoviricetes sp.]